MKLIKNKFLKILLVSTVASSTLAFSFPWGKKEEPVLMNPALHGPPTIQSLLSEREIVPTQSSGTLPQDDDTVFFNLQRDALDPVVFQCISTYSLDNSPFENLMGQFTNLTCSNFNSRAELVGYCKCIKDNVSDVSGDQTEEYKKGLKQLRTAYLFEQFNHLMLSYLKNSEDIGYAMTQDEDIKNLINSSQQSRGAGNICLPGNMNNIIDEINKDGSCIDSEDDKFMKKAARNFYINSSSIYRPLGMKSEKNIELFVEYGKDSTLKGMGEILDRTTSESFSKGVLSGGNPDLSDYFGNKNVPNAILNNKTADIIKDRDRLLEEALSDQPQVSKLALSKLVKSDPFIRNVLVGDQSGLLNGSNVAAEILKENLLRFVTGRTGKTSESIDAKDVKKSFKDNMREKAYKAYNNCQKSIEQIKLSCKYDNAKLLQQFSTPKRIRNITNTMLLGSDGDISNEEYIKKQNMAGYFLCKSYVSDGSGDGRILDLSDGVSGGLSDNDISSISRKVDSPIAASGDMGVEEITSDSSDSTSVSIYDSGSSVAQTQSRLEGGDSTNSNAFGSESGYGMTGPTQNFMSQTMQNNPFIQSPSVVGNYDTKEPDSAQEGPSEAKAEQSTQDVADKRAEQFYKDKMAEQDKKIKELEGKLENAVNALGEVKPGDQAPTGLLGISEEIQREKEELERLRAQRLEAAKKLSEATTEEFEEDKASSAKKDSQVQSKGSNGITSSSSGEVTTPNARSIASVGQASVARQTGSGVASQSEVERNDALLTLYAEPSYDNLISDFNKGKESTIRYIIGKDGKRIPVVYKPKMVDGKIVYNSNNEMEFVMIPLDPQSTSNVVAKVKTPTEKVDEAKPTIDVPPTQRRQEFTVEQFEGTLVE